MSIGVFFFNTRISSLTVQQCTREHLVCVKLSEKCFVHGIECIPSSPHSS